MESNIPSVITTLCLLRKNNHVLLGFKKRGFGIGKWNGIGGKVHAGETIEHAAIRELEEEVGVRAKTLEKSGVVNFYFYNQLDGKDWNMIMHVFTVTAWEGDTRESDEMRPQWYHENKIPFDSMWADDRYWIPYVLAGKKISAEFYFPTMETFDHHSITIL